MITAGLDTISKNIITGGYAYLYREIKKVYSDGGAWGKCLIEEKNALAANYDEAHFNGPYGFRPDHYLSHAGSEIYGPGHYAFGAGPQTCFGSHLASRLLYIVFVRLISAFSIKPSRNYSDWALFNALRYEEGGTSLTTEHQKFKLRFATRKHQILEHWDKEDDECEEGEQF
ncbi:MAG: hypothetical protein Q9166_005802 [cf. Caloplaca sp. 2 TL-2023]